MGTIGKGVTDIFVLSHKTSEPLRKKGEQTMSALAVTEVTLAVSFARNYAMVTVKE